MRFARRAGEELDGCWPTAREREGDDGSDALTDEEAAMAFDCDDGLRPWLLCPSLAQRVSAQSTGGARRWTINSPNRGPLRLPRVPY